MFTFTCFHFLDEESIHDKRRCKVLEACSQRGASSSQLRSRVSRTMRSEGRDQCGTGEAPRAPAILPSNELEEARQTHLGQGPRRRFVEVLALRRVGSCEEERPDVVLSLASGCDSACESPASSRSRVSNPERIASRSVRV